MEGAPQRLWLKHGWAERAGQHQGHLVRDHILGLPRATSPVPGRIQVTSESDPTERSDGAPGMSQNG